MTALYGKRILRNGQCSRLQWATMFLLAVFGVYCVVVMEATAQEGAPPLIPASDAKAKPSPKLDEAHSRAEANERLGKLVTSLVLAQMPHQYTREKNWGNQTERWDGIEWRREGWRLETKRKRKLVNDGTWRRYTAQLVDPKKKFAIRVVDISETEDNKLGVVLDFSAQLKLHGRQSKWVKGVQLYSISADGRARVNLRVHATIGIRLDITRFPPDVVFEPEITKADLAVHEFQLDRVSKVGGEGAQQLTRAVRQILDNEVVEKREKLATKINEQIERNEEHLRLSIKDAVDSDWYEKAHPFLPGDLIRSASDWIDDQ